MLEFVIIIVCFGWLFLLVFRILIFFIIFYKNISNNDNDNCNKDSSFYIVYIELFFVRKVSK